jgi:hypothetical protein
MCARIADLVIGAVLLAACGPPTAARPREGAPVVVGETRRVDAGIVASPTSTLAVTPAPTAALPPVPSPTTTPGHVIAATGGWR